MPEVRTEAQQLDSDLRRQLTKGYVWMNTLRAVVEAVFDPEELDRFADVLRRAQEAEADQKRREELDSMNDLMHLLGFLMPRLLRPHDARQKTEETEETEETAGDDFLGPAAGRQRAARRAGLSEPLQRLMARHAELLSHVQNLQNKVKEIPGDSTKTDAREIPGDSTKTDAREIPGDSTKTDAREIPGDSTKTDARALLAAHADLEQRFVYDAEQKRMAARVMLALAEGSVFLR